MFCKRKLDHCLHRPGARLFAGIGNDSRRAFRSTGVGTLSSVVQIVHGSQNQLERRSYGTKTVLRAEVAFEVFSLRMTSQLERCFCDVSSCVFKTWRLPKKASALESSGHQRQVFYWSVEHCVL